MTTQIDVVDISANINDDTKKPPSSEVKPKAKAKPRAKAKAQIQEIHALAEIKEEITEEMRPIADGAIRRGQPAPSEIKEENEEEIPQEAEIKEEMNGGGLAPPPHLEGSSTPPQIPPKGRNRPELKEKVNCPDCGKEVTVHGLKYTHKRYCKSMQPEPTKQAPRGPELQQPPMPTLTRSITESMEPTEDQIATYLLNQRKLRANKKREQMSSLVSNALPK